MSQRWNKLEFCPHVESILVITDTDHVMAQVDSHQPLMEAQVDPRLVHVGFLVNKVALFVLKMHNWQKHMDCMLLSYHNLDVNFFKNIDTCV